MNPLTVYLFLYVVAGIVALIQLKLDFKRIKLLLKEVEVSNKLSDLEEKYKIKKPFNHRVEYEKYESLIIEYKLGSLDINAREFHRVFRFPLKIGTPHKADFIHWTLIILILPLTTLVGLILEPVSLLLKKEEAITYDIFKRLKDIKKRKKRILRTENLIEEAHKEQSSLMKSFGESIGEFKEEADVLQYI